MISFGWLSVLFITTGDRKERLAQNTFVSFCLSQIVLGFLLILLATVNFDQVLILAYGSLSLISLNSLAIYLSLRFARITMNFYSGLIWCTNMGFMLLSRGDNAVMSTFAVVLMLQAVLAALTVKGRWGVISLSLSYLLLLFDIIFDHHFAIFTIKSTSEFEHFVVIGYYLTTIIMMLIFHQRVMMGLFEENDRETQLREQAQAELKASNHSLMNLNLQLADLNTNLEENIAAVEDANNRLARFAFRHSHHVRAPLARILGLCNVLGVEHSLEEKIRITELINLSAQELDEIVRQMNKLLNEQNPAGHNAEPPQDGSGH